MECPPLCVWVIEQDGFLYPTPSSALEWGRRGGVRMNINSEAVTSESCVPLDLSSYTTTTTLSTAPPSTSQNHPHCQHATTRPLLPPDHRNHETASPPRPPPPTRHHHATAHAIAAILPPSATTPLRRRRATAKWPPSSTLSLPSPRRPRAAAASPLPQRSLRLPPRCHSTIAARQCCPANPPQLHRDTAVTVCPSTPSAPTADRPRRHSADTVKPTSRGTAPPTV